MPKKPPTEKQLAARKKFGEAARARAAAKKAKQINIEEVPKRPDDWPDVPEAPKPQPDTISMEDYADLVRQIKELKEVAWQNQVQDTRVALQGGKLIGTVEKYNLTPEHYPDPTERLSKESKLARFAFLENYLLDFTVAVSEYTTLDGIRTKEPKFTLVLAAYMFDEETGEQTFDEQGAPAAYVVRRLIMHEDPEAALVIAREQGLEVDEENETAFLNEMRYIRMRDFLLECFFPTKPKNINRKTEITVGGTIVETFQVTTEGDEAVRIDYNLIKNRKL